MYLTLLMATFGLLGLFMLLGMGYVVLRGLYQWVTGRGEEYHTPQGNFLACLPADLKEEVIKHNK